MGRPLNVPLFSEQDPIKLERTEIRLKDNLLQLQDLEEKY